MRVRLSLLSLLWFTVHSLRLKSAVYGLRLAIEGHILIIDYSLLCGNRGPTLRLVDDPDLVKRMPGIRPLHFTFTELSSVKARPPSTRFRVHDPDLIKLNRVMAPRSSDPFSFSNSERVFDENAFDRLAVV